MSMYQCLYLTILGCWCGRRYSPACAATYWQYWYLFRPKFVATCRMSDLEFVAFTIFFRIAKHHEYLWGAKVIANGVTRRNLVVEWCAIYPTLAVTLTRCTSMYVGYDPRLTMTMSDLAFYKGMHHLKYWMQRRIRGLIAEVKGFFRYQGCCSHRSTPGSATDWMPFH